MKKILGTLALAITLFTAVDKYQENKWEELLKSEEPQIVEEYKEELVYEEDTDYNEVVVDTSIKTIDTSIKTIDTLKEVGNNLKPYAKKGLEKGKDLVKDAKVVYDHYNQDYTNINLELFDESELISTPYEDYAPLDYLGRTGQANAVLHQSLMPKTDRDSLQSVRPSGWNNEKYDFIKGGWVYNRSHLIGFQLAGENANERNLITGTRQMNIEMIEWENQIADFLKQSPNNYVRYRVTPIYKGEELVARKVIIDAVGYGDDSLNFSVEIMNEQEGIEIDYLTGQTKIKN